MKLKPFVVSFVASFVGLTSALAAPIDFTRPDSLAIDVTPGRIESTASSFAVDAELAQAEQQRFVTDFGEHQLPGYRTVIRVNGKHPYALVLEDYPELLESSLVERGFPVGADTALDGFRFDRGGTDVLVRAGDGPPEMLRILATGGDRNDLVPGQRTGGPAKLVTEAGGRRTLVVPTVTDRPSYRLLSVADSRDAPVTRWLDGGRVLRVEWHDQVDEYRFAADDDGRTRFVLERKRGEHGDEVISAGVPYDPPEQVTGRLLAHWSFDDDAGGARLEGGARLTSGVRGQGIDSVRCDGVGLGELVMPTVEGDLPGKLEWGRVMLPATVFGTITNAMTVTFWYAMPSVMNGAYHPYMKHWLSSDKDRAVFEAGAFRIYPYIHWLNGHALTAAVKGDHRLFGMIGPGQPRDKWNHYAVVFDDDKARLFINGELKLQKTIEHPIGESLAEAEAIVLLDGMWARIDEVRVYDYALDLDAVQREFQMDGQGRLCRLGFDPLSEVRRRSPDRAESSTEGLPAEKGDPAAGSGEVRGRGAESARRHSRSWQTGAQRGIDKAPDEVPDEVWIQDDHGNTYRAEGVELVDGGEGRGRVLRFGEDGGRVLFPETITQGKHIAAVTVALWVKLPAGYKGRGTLIRSLNHGHAGINVGFWNNRLWGTASQNAFKGQVTPGEWTHVMVSYGYNRIRTWINGEKVQDDDPAYPSDKGWGVGRFELSYNTPVEVDDVQLFSFGLSDDQAAAVYRGEDVRRPAVRETGPAGPKTVITAGGGHE